MLQGAALLHLALRLLYESRKLGLRLHVADAQLARRVRQGQTAVFGDQHRMARTLIAQFHSEERPRWYPKGVVRAKATALPLKQ